MDEDSTPTEFVRREYRIENGKIELYVYDDGMFGDTWRKKSTGNLYIRKENGEFEFVKKPWNYHGC